ncbi:MAG: signal peptidase I [Kiritimatiellales bacterium]
MKFFKVRKARKELKEVLHYAKHVRHMHEDIADPEKLQQLEQLEAEAREVRKGGAGELMETAGTAVIKACGKVAPPKKHAKIRENIEVLFVAVAAAMAIRAYFFQPFKIPTGSMQPTLYGITVRDEPTIKSDNPLAMVANMVLFGERRQTVRAKISGYLRIKQSLNGFQEIDLQTSQTPSTHVLYIDNVPHRISDKMLLENRERLISLIGKRINKGDILADDIIKSGDYILVNRIKYNFIRPKRGDITVFDTRELKHPQVRKDAYYIKRMVGLPDETISLDPPYLLVNGKKPTDPRFDKIFNNTNYDGYVFGSPTVNPVLIQKPGDSIKVADDEYLFFGDNTTMSLDGRYFGPVNERQILGPAFFVCWPLDRAGFAEISH